MLNVEKSERYDYYINYNYNHYLSHFLLSSYSKNTLFFPLYVLFYTYLIFHDIHLIFIKNKQMHLSIYKLLF